MFNCKSHNEELIYIRNQFEKCDFNRKGYLTRSELILLCKKLNNPLLYENLLPNNNRNSIIDHIYLDSVMVC